MTFARRFFADRRRSLLWWGIALAAMILVNTAFYPSFKNDRSYDDLIKQMPDALRAMMGASEGGYSSPSGFLNSQVYALMLPMILFIFGVAAGARAIGGSEEDGTLEPLLAEPVARRRVALERGLAVLGLLAVMDLLSLVVTMGPAPFLGLLEGVGVVHFLGVTLALLVVVGMFTALTFAVGCATGRKAMAQAIGGGVAVGTYVLYGLEKSVHGLSFLRFVVPWDWYLHQNLLLHAPGAVVLVTPLVLGGLAVAVGVLRFERRDLRLP